MSTDSVLFLALMLALIACNAFFVAIEYALVSLRPSRVQELIDSGNQTARVLQHLQQNINTSISGSQLGITFASLALGWVCETPIHDGLVWLIGLIPGVGTVHVPEGVAMGLALLVMSSVHAVFGEQVPKFTALRLSERVALVLARPFSIYCRMIWPLIRALDFVTSGVLSLLGLKKHDHDGPVHSMEELEILFEQSEQAGELHPRSTEMLKGVFDLDELTAEQIMVPRSKIDCIDRRLSLRDAFAVASRTKHSRLPVVDKDRVVGVLHVKDLFDVIQSHMQAVSPAVMVTVPNTVRLESLFRKIYAVPRNKTARECLDGMRKRNVQIAIVQDDEQRAIGLVTMENIVEKLVGEIHDEHDKVPPTQPPQ